MCYFLLLITFAFGQDCVSGDCLNGYGIIIYQDGSEFMGIFQNG